MKKSIKNYSNAKLLKKTLLIQYNLSLIIIIYEIKQRFYKNSKAI